MKKFYFSVLLIFCCLLFHNVSAASYGTYDISYLGGQILNNYEKNLNIGAAFRNAGRGYVNFNMIAENYAMIYDVSIGSSDMYFNCDIGTVQGYVDSGTQRTIYSVSCPVDIGSNGLTNIHLKYTKKDSNTYYAYFSDRLSFVPLENGYNQSTQQQINTNLGYIITAIGNLRNDTQDNGLKLDTIINILNNSQTNNKLDNINTSINNQTSTITSDNVSGASSSADDLKNNSAFNDSTGLSAIVSMPLSIVNSFSNTCQPITLSFPYFDNFELPCFQSYISSKIPALGNILKIVINGFLIYRVLLDIFRIVRGARNPDDDRIEVLDL